MVTNTKTSHFKKHLKIGPGGKKCPCCFPAPGSRKEVYRSVKRKMKRNSLIDGFDYD